MIRRESGFTLVELLITTAIFVIMIAGAHQMFIPLLSLSKTQSKIVETNIEGIVGLELMRRDIENAGYGLAWTFDPPAIPYIEIEDDPNGESFNDSGFSAPPRAVALGNNTELNGSDRLVIKAINVTTNKVAEKWTYLNKTGTVPLVHSWPTTSAISPNLSNTDRVIVLSPGSSSVDSRTLVMRQVNPPLVFWDTYLNAAAGTFAEENASTRIIYGIDTINPKMPFNRADYYIDAAGLPERCAPGTGVLRKHIASQEAGKGFIPDDFPILDCVATMQVLFAADKYENGTLLPYDKLSDLLDKNANGWVDAEEIRTQLREVRVFILAQEGQKDRGYTHTKQTYPVGYMGVVLDVGVIPDWTKYRWKLYTMAVKLNNLR